MKCWQLLLCLLKRSEKHQGHCGLWCFAKHIFANVCVISAPASCCQGLCSYCSGPEHGARPGLSGLVPSPPLGSMWCSWGFWTWLMFLLCFLTSEHLKECIATDYRGTFVAWSWGYLMLLRPCRSRCCRVPVWEKAGGWCGEKEAKPGVDCPYHLLRMSWDELFPTLHLGFCRREPAVLSPEDLEMNWWFSKVDAHGLGVTGESELACRLDEGMAGQASYLTDFVVCVSDLISPSKGKI